MKFLYEFFVTRWPPLPLSATIAPSSTRQLASPVWVQPSKVFPSNSWVQPGPAWLAACGANWMAAKDAPTSPKARANARVEASCMVISSLYADDIGCCASDGSRRDFQTTPPTGARCTSIVEVFMPSWKPGRPRPRKRVAINGSGVDLAPDYAAAPSGLRLLTSLAPQD